MPEGMQLASVAEGFATLVSCEGACSVVLTMLKHITSRILMRLSMCVQEGLPEGMQLASVAEGLATLVSCEGAYSAVLTLFKHQAQ